MVDYHDGWSTKQDEDALLKAYNELEEEVDVDPIVKFLHYEDQSQSKSKRKSHRVFSGDGDDEFERAIFIPSDDEDDSPFHIDEKPRFFTPPLQVQRNSFVKDTLSRFNYFWGDLNSMAVLGCGELSLERFLLKDLSALGFRKVYSVDIDGAPLAKGIFLLNQEIDKCGSIIRSRNSNPVLLEQFEGSILEADPRLSNITCVCSTEVIEHIPVEEAEVFMRVVLGEIKPRLFILSTPNHEYNAAFGMSEGEFRHDDHKYEFTRSEFRDWVARICMDFTQYSYQIHYVGNINGYTELDGATQFAVITSDVQRGGQDLSALPKRYSKVGEVVAHFGIYIVVPPRAKAAIKKYLDHHPLDSSNLYDSGIAKFWKIYLDDLIPLMELPPVIIHPMHHTFLLASFRSVASGLLYSHPANDHEGAYIIVPEDVSFNRLMQLLK